MKKSPKTIIIVCIIALVMMALFIATLMDESKVKNKVENTNNVNTVENNIEDDTEEEEPDEEQESNYSNVEIEFENKSKVYNIKGTDYTITVNQSYGNVNAQDKNVEKMLQEELNKISDEEFNEYQKNIEERLNSKYPIDADYMESYGNLSVSWSFKDIRNDSKVISIRNESSGGLGGVSWSEVRGFSFNPKTGERLTIKDIANDENTLKRYINLKARNYIEENYERLGVNPEVVENINSAINIDDLDWYLDKYGLSIFFKKYQISMNTFEYTILYDDLAEYIKADFINK